MANAVHTTDTAFVGVDQMYENYAGIASQPFDGATDPIRTAVKSLEAIRHAGVPGFLGYDMGLDHPSIRQAWFDQVIADNKTIHDADVLTAQDVIDAH